MRKSTDAYLEQNQKKTVEGLAFVKVGQIGDIDVFHTALKLNAFGWG